MKYTMLAKRKSKEGKGDDKDEEEPVEEEIDEPVQKKSRRMAAYGIKSK